MGRVVRVCARRFDAITEVLDGSSRGPHSVHHGCRHNGKCTREYCTRLPACRVWLCLVLRTVNWAGRQMYKSRPGSQRGPPCRCQLIPALVQGKPDLEGGPNELCYTGNPVAHRVHAAASWQAGSQTARGACSRRPLDHPPHPQPRCSATPASAALAERPPPFRLLAPALPRPLRADAASHAGQPGSRWGVADPQYYW
jgi:hypothetical protein